VAFLPIAFRRLRDAYPSVEIVFPLQTVAPDSESEDQEVTTADWQPTYSARPGGVDLSPSLRPFDWSTSPWLERLVAKMFDARDKQVAEFLCGGVRAPWSGLWLLALKFAAAGLAALPLLDPRIGLAIGGIACLLALPILGGRWPGLQNIRFPATIQPLFAALPISYPEVTSVVLKVNLARYLAWSPIFLGYGAMLGWRLASSPALGLKIASGIFFLLLWSQPIVIAGIHSRGTNDTSRFTLHMVGGAGVILCLAISYAVSIFALNAGITATGRAWFTAAIVTILLSPSLIWFAYKVWYERGKIDTVRVAE
jgi:hypothetical protein